MKVVSLAGIRLIVSSSSLECASKAWARIEGLALDETPFSFGGALYPFRVVWSLGAHGVVEMISPLGVRFCKCVMCLSQGDN